MKRWLPPAVLALCAGLGVSTAPAAQNGAREFRLEPAAAPTYPVRSDAAEAVDDAMFLYGRALTGQLIVTTEPIERNGTLVHHTWLQGFFDDNAHELFFNFGDEAFETERYRGAGAGQGPLAGPVLPARPQRIHDGERGGLDSASCRSCHFNGGADGSGTATQLGLFRGDGQHLDSATSRDAPHLKGVGYLAILARDLEAQVQLAIEQAVFDAFSNNMTIERAVIVQDLDFGLIRAEPDGTVDKSGLRALNADGKLGIFGHKGRHTSLVELADEAMAVHHGMQTASRVALFADRAGAFLGDGPAEDPDADGMLFEGGVGQAVLLAGYMSMLGLPEIRAPQDPLLAIEWGRGRRHMDTMGCTACHKAEFRLYSDEVPLQSLSAPHISGAFYLQEAGDDPVPRDHLFVEGENDPRGAHFSIFPFTDLRRHDMGDALSDPVDEVLPTGEVVDRSMWLTRPLWGIADTAPFLHDGRAPTLRDAILAHAGEAQASRDAFAAASEAERRQLELFLMSLTRLPSLFVE